MTTTFLLVYIQLHNDQCLHEYFGIITGLYTSKREHSSLLRVPWSPQPEISGRWSMTGSVESLLCSVIWYGQVATRFIGTILYYDTKTTGDVLSVLASDWNG